MKVWHPLSFFSHYRSAFLQFSLFDLSLLHSVTPLELTPLLLTHTVLSHLPVPEDRMTTIIPAVRYKYVLPLNKQHQMTPRWASRIPRAGHYVIKNRWGKHEEARWRVQSRNGPGSGDVDRDTRVRKRQIGKRGRMKEEERQTEIKSECWMGREMSTAEHAARTHSREISLSYFDRATYFRLYVAQNT